MSKKRGASDATLAMDAAAWRQRIRQLTIPMREYWPEDAAEIIEANAGFVVDDVLARPAKYQITTLRPMRGKGYAIGADDLSAVLRHLFHAGFLEAVLMHRRELMATGDWIEWNQKKEGGGDKGREGGTRKRVALAQRIRDKWAAMEAAGENPTNATVAAAIKQEYGRGSVRTVQRAFREPAKTTTPVKRTKR